MSLRDRCKQMLDRLHRDAMLRQGSPVDDLLAFVQAEIGRKADRYLEKTNSLILYFGSDADREEFMAMIRQVKPGMMAKKIP